MASGFCVFPNSGITDGGERQKKSEEWRQVAGQLRKKWAGKGERMGVTGNWQVEE